MFQEGKDFRLMYSFVYFLFKHTVVDAGKEMVNIRFEYIAVYAVVFIIIRKKLC